MKCTVIDICAPLDFNIDNRQITKIDKHMLLVSELQQLHPRYSYPDCTNRGQCHGHNLQAITKTPQEISHKGERSCQGDQKITESIHSRISQNNEDLYEDVNWNCMNLDIISEVFKHIFTEHVSMDIWILKFQNIIFGWILETFLQYN